MSLQEAMEITEKYAAITVPEIDYVIDILKVRLTELDKEISDLKTAKRVLDYETRS